MLLEFQMVPESSNYLKYRTVTSILGLAGLPQTKEGIVLLATYESKVKSPAMGPTLSFYPLLFGPSADGPFFTVPTAPGQQIFRVTKGGLCTRASRDDVHYGTRLLLEQNPLVAAKSPAWQMSPEISLEFLGTLGVPAS